MVGFDLDLTLIDTRPAFLVAFARLRERTGIDIPPEALGSIGLPVREMCGPWVAEERIGEAIEILAAAFMGEGLPHLSPLRGAPALVDDIREAGGRVVVVTSRREEVARAFLRATGIAVDAVCGGVTGERKAEPLRGFGVAAYIGDHPLDMVGATAAEVRAIGVTTGSHDASALLAAGADRVVTSLLELSVNDAFV